MTLKDGFKLLKIDANEEFESKIDKYIKELLLFNSSYDLVNAENYEDVFTKHILDSLAAVNELDAIFRQSGKNHNEIYVADAGSGGGLPGIPLASYFTDINFTLIERMSKRCLFLENCTAILGLKNVKVLNSDIEKAPAGKFDVVVFRAFRPLDEKMTKTLLKRLAPEGTLAAYKAKMEKISDEMKAIEHLTGSWEIKKLESSFLDKENDIHQRNLVLIRGK